LEGRIESRTDAAGQARTGSRDLARCGQARRGRQGGTILARSEVDWQAGHGRAWHVYRGPVGSGRGRRDKGGRGRHGHGEAGKASIAGSGWSVIGKAGGTSLWYRRGVTSLGRAGGLLLVASRQRPEWHGRRGGVTAQRVTAGAGQAGQAGFVRSRPVAVGRDRLRQGRRGVAVHGSARSVRARLVRRGRRVRSLLWKGKRMMTLRVGQEVVGPWLGANPGRRLGRIIRIEGKLLKVRFYFDGKSRGIADEAWIDQELVSPS
jgi:hypothetical protein